MPRDLKAHENQKKASARRAHALARLDLREPTVPRESAAGPMSHAVKKVDPVTALAIQAFLAKKARADG